MRKEIASIAKIVRESDKREIKRRKTLFSEAAAGKKNKVDIRENVEEKNKH